MSRHVIIFAPDGQGRCLHTDAIDLRKIGSLVIERATYIEFDNQAQCWRVHDTTGVILFSDSSRQLCLDWERDHLQPQEEMTHENRAITKYYTGILRRVE